MDSDQHLRSTCGVLDLRQQRVRRSVWQWRWSPASMVCRWRSDGGEEFGAAPVMMVVTTRSGATNTTLAAIRRHRCRHGMVAVDCAWLRLRPRGSPGAGGIEGPRKFARVNPLAPGLARARGADADDRTGGAVRATGWRATAIGGNKAIANPTAYPRFCTKSLSPTNVYASAIGLCIDSIITQSSKPSNSDF